MRKLFSFIDVFAAPGGLSLGFKMAGFKPLAGIDIDKDGLETFSRNFPDSKVLLMNVRELGGRELLSEIGFSRGEIDVMGGCPPCQGFSNVGRVKIASLVRNGIWKLENGNPRLIDDPRNLLYKEFVRLITDCNPKFFVMENVHGMLSYRNGQLIEEAKKELEALGYIVDYRLLDAAQLGVPQHRKRVFLIGNRLEIRNPFPNNDPEGDEFHALFKHMC